MSPPDLGGGVRRSRRPGFLSSAFFVFLLLFSLPFPQSTLEQCLSGDSESFFWVRSSTSLGFRSAAVLHRPSVSCQAVSAIFRSEFKESLSLDPNHRSELFSSPSTRVVSRLMLTSEPSSEPYESLRVRLVHASSRICFSLDKSEKARSFSNHTSAPLMGRSRNPHPFNPAGDSSLVRCVASKDRYKLPTPIVWNINCKFPVNFGVLHGSNSVMGKSYHFSGIYPRREDLICGCNLPILNRLCNRLCTAFRFDLSSRRILPAIARNFGSSLAELSTGNMIGLTLTGKATSSIPVCSTTVLGHNQSAIPYEEEASKGNGCLLTTLSWEKGLGPMLKVESPIAGINVVVVSIGFFKFWVCCNVKNWTIDPIKLSV